MKILLNSKMDFKFKMAAQTAAFKLFNTRYGHFYNLKLVLYSGYLSQIFRYDCVFLPYVLAKFIK